MTPEEKKVAIACMKAICGYCRRNVLYDGDGWHFVDDGLQARGTQGRRVLCHAQPIRERFPELK
jgi:hypothetical protein